MKKVTITLVLTDEFINDTAKFRDNSNGISVIAGLALANAKESNMTLTQEEVEQLTNGKTTTLRVTEEMNVWLNQQTKPTGTKSAYIRKAIVEFIKKV